MKRLILVLTILPFSVLAVDMNTVVSILENPSTALTQTRPNACHESSASLSPNFQSCQQAENLFQGQLKNMSPYEHGARYQELNDRVQVLLENCLDERFERCYPELQDSIAINELERMYEGWTSDTRFRYPTGFGMCHIRAESLAYELANRGYEARTLRITNSPALIAMDRDHSGNLTGNYSDYGSAHYVIEVDARNEDGTTTKYILDPQYMNTPMTHEDYFLRTTGQEDCTKREEDGPNLDFTSCIYHELRQNEPSDSRIPLSVGAKNDPLESPFYACGWAKNDLDKTPEIASRISADNENKTLRCLNCEGGDYDTGDVVTEDSYKDVIVETYRRYGENLEFQLQQTNAQIEMIRRRLHSDVDMTGQGYNPFEDDEERLDRLTLIREAILAGLRDLPSKIEEVQLNLVDHSNPS